MRPCCVRKTLGVFFSLSFLACLVLHFGSFLELQIMQFWMNEGKPVQSDSNTQMFYQKMAPRHEVTSHPSNQEVPRTTWGRSRTTTTTTTPTKTPTTTPTVKPTAVNLTTTTNATRTTTNSSAPLLPTIKVGSDEKWVILHTYMRGGSTFLGSMFEKNPDAFYMFEPLFSIYHGMLGVPNTIHPLRVYTTENATWRNQDEEEERYVSKALLSMFTCNFKELPLETLTSHYMDFTKVYNYTRCLHRGGYPLGQCLKPIQINCPSQLETAFENKCHLYMAKVHNDSSFPGMDQLNSTAFAKFPNISSYTNCMGNLRQKIPSCLHHIKVPCKGSRLRIFKMIRGNVGLIKKMMEANPNTYVIYQVRDPRGIVLSRRTTVTLSFDIKLEGKMLCEKIRRDLREVMELQKLYPTKVKHIRYEDMAQNVLGMAQSIYRFLGEEMHSTVTKYLQSAAHSDKKAGNFDTERKNSTQTAFAWRKKITKDLKEAMDLECLDIYKHLHYDL